MPRLRAYDAATTTAGASPFAGTLLPPVENRALRTTWLRHRKRVTPMVIASARRRKYWPVKHQEQGVVMIQ